MYAKFCMQVKPHITAAEGRHEHGSNNVSKTKTIVFECFQVVYKWQEKFEGDESVYPGRTFTKDREIDAEHLRCKKAEKSG